MVSPASTGPGASFLRTASSTPLTKCAAASPLNRRAISIASLMTMAGAIRASSSSSKTAIRRMFRSTGAILGMRQWEEVLSISPSISARRATTPRTSQTA